MEKNMNNSENSAEILTDGDVHTIEVSKPKKKLTSTTDALLSTHGFNYVVSVFVSTFLISYIYKISDNYVLNIGLFYCFNYLSMGIFSYIVSRKVSVPEIYFLHTIWLLKIQGNE